MCFDCLFYDFSLPHPQGKLLIQRDESQHAKPARLFYSKLPSNIAQCDVLLMDPMLATGASAILAVQVRNKHDLQ